MKRVEVPFGHGFLSVSVDDDTPVLTPGDAQYDTTTSQSDKVKAALENPIGSERLADLASAERGVKTVVVISSDHTRPVPSKITMPLILKEIRSKNPEVDITILVATGFHRGSTHEELVSKYGDEIVANERIINHDCTTSPTVSLGVLPSGAECVINKLAVECDLLVAEGFIEPHFFAGYSGSRKSVLPGVASRITVLGNHCSKFIDNKKSRAGILEGNPIHTDMIDAAEKANLAFIVNVVLNEDKEVIAAFTGDRTQAHAQGCDFVDTFSQVKPVISDIVITSNGGYPLDQNVYQAVKSISAADATCKPGGVIICASECSDGHGGEVMYETFKAAKSPAAVHAEIMATPMDKTVPDQWQTQFYADIMMRNTIIMVSDPKNKEIIEDMFMIYASDLEDALAKAREIKPDGSLAIIPNGISVIVKP